MQLYYGARLVAFIKETVPNIPSATPTLLVGQDPRRIRYELIFTNFDSGPLDILLGQTLDALTTIGLEYQVPENSTLIIERSFLTDLDGVTVSVFCNATGSGFTISSRETILTPAPVDEGP